MIEFTADQIKKAETLLGGIKGELPKAQANAINRSLTTARAEIVRAVRQEYIVAAAAVRKTINIKMASAVNPVGTVYSTGSPIALSKFDVSPTRPVKRNTKSVVARTKKTEGRKPITHAFVARMKSGHIGVFERTSEARYLRGFEPRAKKYGSGNTKGRKAIDQKFGPSIPQMIGSENVSRQIEAKAAETMDKRLDHEINRILEAGRI